MLYALISMVIWNISEVFKKELLWKYNPLKMDYIGHLWIIIVLSFFIKSSFIELWTNDILLTFITVLLFGIWRVNQSYVLRKEKISKILPYNNFIPVIIIIASFFIFKDISNISFAIAILASLIMIASSFDFKNMKMSKTILIYILCRLFPAIGQIILWMIVLEKSALSYFVVYMILSVFVMGVLYYWWMDKTKDPEITTRKRIKYHITPLLWWTSWLISLVAVEDLWLTIATLASFLYLVLWFIMAYIFFKDIPAKKDILVAITVLTLIWLWYYLK